MEYEYTPTIDEFVNPITGTEYNTVVFNRNAHDDFSIVSPPLFQSWDVINGWLDYSNFAEDITYRKIKSDILTQVFVAHANANNDYFSDITQNGRPIPIPGLCRTFKVNNPFGTNALISWHLLVSNGGSYDPDPLSTHDLACGFYLYTENTDNPIKLIGKVQAGLMEMPDFIPRFNGSFGRTVLSGHTMLALPYGLQSLGIAMEAESKHVRIHSRALQILLLK